eukprot:3330590-Alexandrium_andersonii.AAC.1
MGACRDLSSVLPSRFPSASLPGPSLSCVETLFALLFGASGAGPRGSSTVSSGLTRVSFSSRELGSRSCGAL